MSSQNIPNSSFMMISVPVFFFNDSVGDLGCCGIFFGSGSFVSIRENFACVLIYFPPPSGIHPIRLTHGTKAKTTFIVLIRARFVSAYTLIIVNLPTGSIGSVYLEAKILTRSLQ